MKTLPMRLCPKCGEQKPESQFSNQGVGRKTVRCKKCVSIQASRSQALRRFKKLDFEELMELWRSHLRMQELIDAELSERIREGKP